MNVVVFMTCAWVMIGWVSSGLGILLARREGSEPASWVRWCWAELRPFYLPANAVYAICGYLISPSTLAGSAISIPLALMCWRLLKDIDDDADRWKRRAAKLAAKVERKGARLVVVPVTAGGPR